MSKSKKAAAEEFSLFDLANAHLLLQQHANITILDLVDLLIDEAVEGGDEEDNATYAVLAARLLTACNLKVMQVE